MITLNFEQRRVLGVLIEKSLTTPDSYPMTINSIVAGCNQKTNRDPVADLSEGEIGRVLHDLMLHGFAKLAPTGSGARSNRFQHNVEEKLGWVRSYQAILAELMLRGPQTQGELRTRCSRMTNLPDLLAVERLLNELATRAPSLVEAMPREAGRSAIRYQHLLYPEGEGPTPTVVAQPPIATPSPSSVPTNSGDLANRVTALEAAVSALQTQVEALQNSDSDFAGPGA
jgi:hypothetical protein